MDRLLGEHGIAQDTPAGRQELERRLEQRRLEAGDEEALQSLRAEWCLGGEGFRREKLAQMEGKLKESHAGELRRETSEARAERMISEELVRLGWSRDDLATRRKSDPCKLAVTTRLRKETTLSIREIAARVHLGTSKGANSNLHKWMRADRPKEQAQSNLNFS